MTGNDSTKESAPTLVGVDIDGVLADPTHRLHHLSQKPRNWRGFFSEAKDDLPLPTGIEMVHDVIEQGHNVVYVSGRPEGLRSDTVAWFRRHQVPEAELILRPRSDYRAAPVWKLSIYEDLRQYWRIHTVIDDDLRVVMRLRDAGFTVQHADWYQPPAEDHSRLAQAQNELGRS